MTYKPRKCLFHKIWILSYTSFIKDSLWASFLYVDVCELFCVHVYVLYVINVFVWWTNSNNNIGYKRKSSDIVRHQWNGLWKDLMVCKYTSTSMNPMYTYTYVCMYGYVCMNSNIQKGLYLWRYPEICANTSSRKDLRIFTQSIMLRR